MENEPLDRSEVFGALITCIILAVSVVYAYTGGRGVKDIIAPHFMPTSELFIGFGAACVIFIACVVFLSGLVEFLRNLLT